MLTATEPAAVKRRLAEAFDAFGSAEPAWRSAAWQRSEYSPPTPADAVLNALPHPVIVVASDGKVADANAAAEAFFEVSVPLLRRHLLHDLVPFGSPLLSLVDQVRTTGAAVNEYKVDLGTPRNPGDRLVDLHVAPLSDGPTTWW